MDQRKSNWVGGSFLSVAGRFDGVGHLPVPRRQCVQLFVFRGSGDDAFEHVGEPGQRINPTEFGDLDQDGDDCPVASATARAGALALGF